MRNIGFLLALLPAGSHAFGIIMGGALHCSSPSYFSLSNSQGFALKSTSDDNAGLPKTLIDKVSYETAIDTLKTSWQLAATDDNTITADYTTALGKLIVELNIEGEPGIDLTEAAGIVLVSGVTQETKDNTGIQMFDTIVSVSTSDKVFQADTKGRDIEQTATALMGASKHALENGQKTVELELNRLIKLYYSDPSKAQSQ
jgi:hypothetical protein